MEKIGIIIIVLALVSLAPFLIHLNTPIGPGLSFFFLFLGVTLFVIGFIKRKVSTINFPPFFYKVVFWLRKILGFLILGDLLWFSVKAGLAGGPFFFILPMFFNVAIIFCLVLLLSKSNGLFVGILLLLLGLFYSYIPLLPGPTLTMEGMNLSNLLIPSENQILFLSIFIAKCLTLISSIFLFISGFIKYPRKNGRS
ncbi:hypothetical protein MUP46_04270 [Patescibacteria group bacterium]|nr:hypothetical protein [Patescibacteria group bacterium]